VGTVKKIVGRSRAITSKARVSKPSPASTAVASSNAL